VDKAAHEQRLGLMWFSWETMHLLLVIVMITIAQFSQKVDLCGLK
jgi:hypothetical protein